MDKMTAYYYKQKESFLKKTKLELTSQNINFEFYENNNTEPIANIFVNKKQTLKIKYQVLGYSNLVASTFTWAWCNPFIEKNLIKSANDIKNIIDLEKKKDGELYHYMVNQPTLYLDNQKIIGLIGLCLYYTKGIFVLENEMGTDQIEYILVQDIINIS